jgi:DNA-binding Xre family transcriptional regulator
MGEVAAPRGLEIGKQRDAFRAFMIARHLRPTEWARAAGIPAGEILAFLTGKSRNIAPSSVEKLARAAGCAPEDIFGSL